MAVDKAVSFPSLRITRPVIAAMYAASEDSFGEGDVERTITRYLHDAGFRYPEPLISRMLVAQGIIYRRRMQLAEGLIPHHLQVEYQAEARELERTIWEDCSEVRPPRKVLARVCTKRNVAISVSVVAVVAIIAHPTVWDAIGAAGLAVWRGKAGLRAAAKFAPRVGNLVAREWRTVMHGVEIARTAVCGLRGSGRAA